MKIRSRVGVPGLQGPRREGRTLVQIGPGGGKGKAPEASESLLPIAGRREKRVLVVKELRRPVPAGNYAAETAATFGALATGGFSPPVMRPLVS